MTEQPKRIIGSALIFTFVMMIGCRSSLVPATASQAPENRPIEVIEAANKNGGFVGSGECRSCHPGIHDRWKMSPHAQGLTVNDRHLPPHHGSCDRCHHTADVEDSVGCEACHGPRRDHVVSPSITARAPCRLCDIQKRCIQCHNRHIDPGFDAGRDWSRVDHGSDSR